MKKEYNSHPEAKSYNFVMDNSNTTYKIVIEPRYADIIAVVEVYKISH